MIIQTARGTINFKDVEPRTQSEKKQGRPKKSTKGQSYHVTIDQPEIDALMAKYPDVPMQVVLRMLAKKDINQH